MSEFRFHEGAGFAEVGCGAGRYSGMMTVLEVGETAQHTFEVRSSVATEMVLHRITNGSCEQISACVATSADLQSAQTLEFRTTLDPGRYQLIFTTLDSVPEGQRF